MNSFKYFVHGLRGVPVELGWKMRKVDLVKNVRRDGLPQLYTSLSPVKAFGSGLGLT